MHIHLCLETKLVYVRLKKNYTFSFFPTKVHRFSGNRFVLLYLEIKLDIQRKGNSFLYESKKKFWSDKTNKRKPNSVMFFVYFNSSKKKITIKNIYFFFFFPCGGGGAWWRYM